MDPDACLARFDAAIKAQDWEEALERLEDLGDWLKSGGFPPKNLHQSLDALWGCMEVDTKRAVILAELVVRAMVSIESRKGTS